MPGTTTKWAIPYSGGGDIGNTIDDTNQAQAARIADLLVPHSTGSLANRPAASPGAPIPPQMYTVTGNSGDPAVGQSYLCTGIAWIDLTPARALHAQGDNQGDIGPRNGTYSPPGIHFAPRAKSLTISASAHVTSANSGGGGVISATVTVDGVELLRERIIFNGLNDFVAGAGLSRAVTAEELAALGVASDGDVEFRLNIVSESGTLYRVINSVGRVYHLSVTEV